MANWTQTNSIQYKPYVAVNPVQAMTEVGIAREQELQLGVQKVNSYFEQIGGLDIYKDSEKQYVEQLLGSLKTGITKNLSGDFSDQRIINQIGGAATQIYKDPRVQRAVVSTGAIRKGASDFDQYKKDGKYSVAQQYVFDYDVNAYLQSADPNAGFSGKASQYSDYRKKATDALKAATGDETIRDDAFTVGPNGQLVLSDTTVRNKLAGISPARVQQILMSSLSPEDFQQIAAEGRYNYSNKSPEQFAVDLQSSYKSSRDTVVDYIDKLESAKTTTSDAAQINQLNQEIEGEKQRLNGLEREYNNILISGDPEQAKAQKGTFDFINGFSNAFAYKQTSQTYSGKTPQEMMMWREDTKLDNYWKGLNYNLDAQKLVLAQNQDKREEAKAKAEKEALTFEGLPIPRTQEELPVITEATVVERLAQQTAPLVAAKEAFLNSTIFPDVATNKEDWYEAQKVAYALNPNNVSPAVKDYFEQNINGKPLWEQERQVGATQQMLVDANKSADAKGLNTESLIPKLAPVTLRFNDDGSSYTYTPKEFVQAIPKFSKYKTTYPNSPRVDVDYAKAKQELSPKEYKLFEQHEKGNSTVKQYVENYQKAVLSPGQERLAARSKFITESLQSSLTANQQVTKPITTTTPAQVGNAQAVLNSFITLSGEKGAIADSPLFDKNVAAQLAVDPKASYELVVNEGSEFDPETYKMIVRGVVDKKPVETQINLTPQQKIQVFGNSGYSDPAQRLFNDKYENQIRKAGGNTTAMNGRSFLQTRDFPNLSVYGVLGDVNKTSTGKYYLNLQVRDPLTNQLKTLQYPSTPISGAGIIDVMSALNDSSIFGMFNKTPEGNPATPTPQQLGELKKAAKKPIFQ